MRAPIRLFRLEYSSVLRRRAYAAAALAAAAGWAASGCAGTGGLPAPPSAAEARPSSDSAPSESTSRDSSPYLGARRAVVEFYSEMQQQEFAAAAERLTGEAREATLEAAGDPAGDGALEEALAEGSPDSQCRRILGGRPVQLVDRHPEFDDRESETRIVLYNIQINQDGLTTRIVVVRRDGAWRIQQTERIE